MHVPRDELKLGTGTAGRALSTAHGVPWKYSMYLPRVYSVKQCHTAAQRIRLQKYGALTKVSKQCLGILAELYNATLRC